MSRPCSDGARTRRVPAGSGACCAATWTSRSAPLERRFLARLRLARLPRPRTNRPVGGRRVDCRWAKPALTVELDGYRYHGSRHAWERDRRREREAYARGDQFRRYTYGDVFEDPDPMLRELRALLSETILDRWGVGPPKQEYRAPSSRR